MPGRMPTPPPGPKAGNVASTVPALNTEGPSHAAPQGDHTLTDHWGRPSNTRTLLPLSLAGMTSIHTPTAPPKPRNSKRLMPQSCIKHDMMHQASGCPPLPSQMWWTSRPKINAHPSPQRRQIDQHEQPNSPSTPPAGPKADAPVKAHQGYPSEMWWTSQEEPR